jgi:hypothetical protein
MSTKRKRPTDNNYDYLPATGPLSKTNRSFHRAYSDLVAVTLKRLGGEDAPVIIVAGDTVHLLWNGEEEKARIVPDQYHNAKAFSHLPFGLYLSLQPNGEGHLQDRTRQNLEKAINDAIKAIDGIAEDRLPAEIERINRSIVDRSRKFVDEIIESEKVEPSHIQAYARSVAPLLLKNVAFAAKLELDSLHRQVMTWKKRMSRSVWKSLFVLICAGHQERYRETTKQYFQRLVGEKNSFDARFENRVIYAESIRDIPAALDLLARHIVDQEASVVFFDHATRLQKDLLTNASTRHVKKLIP